MVGGQPTLTVGALLRTALQLLEKDEIGWSRRDEKTGHSQLEGPDANDDRYALSFESRTAPGYENSEGGEGAGDEAGGRFSSSRREWLAAQRDNRLIQVAGDSMAPILADGASVAYAKSEEDIQHLDGKMVVTWVENQPMVRWFQNCGRFALLRAENPNTVPQQVLVDLEESKPRPRFRRVVGFNSPH